MVLNDIIDLLDENKTTELVCNNKTVSYYDGKNNIDSYYNSCQVLGISANDDKIIIDILD